MKAIVPSTHINKEPVIELAAIAGKIAIEQTKLHPVAKASINWAIDEVATYLKKECLLSIEKIQRTAKNFDIDKMVVIFYGFRNGEEFAVIRVYGRQSEAFIRAVGMRVISEESQSTLLEIVKRTEEEFGIVIYEKGD